MDKTLVITTGGTIDAMYDPERGTPYVVPVPDAPEKSVIPQALEKMGVKGGCDFWPFSMKDSKFITKDDLDAILQRIEEGHYKHVLIVHGTDTMPRSGRYLMQQLEERGMKDTTVTLTGAMYPLRDSNRQLRGLDASGKPDEQAPMCDGWRHLRLALRDAVKKKPGVYIEMGDGPWDPRMVEKEVETHEVDHPHEPDQKVAHVKHSGFVLRKEPSTEMNFD